VTRAAERAELRREEILDASERVFATKGYHAAGIADIATDLGIGHGTFYRYFKNKHDIAVHVIDRIVTRFAAIGFAEEPEAAGSLAEYRAQVERMLHGWLALGESHPLAMRFFHDSSASVDPARIAALVEASVVHTSRFLDNGVVKGFVRPDLDVRATSEMLVALILEGTRRTLAMPNADARRRWAEAGLALMFDGVRGRRAP